MTTPGRCASGCVQPGHDGCGKDAADCECACHNGSNAFRPPCDQSGGCGPHEPDPECRGCQPRPATRGVLCDRCDTRLTTALTTAPALVMRIRASLHPGGIRQGGEVKRRANASASPAPINLTAVDHADRIYVLLRAAVGLAVAELPGMVGPVEQPAWRTFDPDNGMWTVAGLPDGSTGREAAPYARWLSTHLEAITAHEWAADLVSDEDLPVGCVSLATAVHRAAGVFPLVERPSFVNPALEPARCPRCELRSLHRTPPETVGAPVLVACINPSCAWAGTDEDLTELVVPSPRRSA